jgi:hypothetical protein
MSSEAISILFDRGLENFFSPMNVMLCVVGFVCLYLAIYVKTKRNSHLSYYRFLIPAFLVKLVFVLANCLFYIVAYKGGGDSISYWRGAEILNNLFHQNPSMYFQELFFDNSHLSINTHFNSTTGYPYQDIYNESEAFFVSRITSVITFFTFRSYLLVSIIFAYFSTIASWKLFELVRSFNMHNDRILAFSIFFVPSLGFWCSGLSKDSIVYICICYFFYYLHKIISPGLTSKRWDWLYLFAVIFIIIKVRGFVLMTLLLPLFLALGVRLSNRMNQGNIIKGIVKISFGLVCVGGLVFFLQSSSAASFIREAEIVNQDMTTNQTYGDKRYNIGDVDFTPIGMISAAPLAIFAGIYRPLLPEALSFSLFLNGLESTVLLYLTLRFITKKGLPKRIKTIRKSEFLIFSFFFLLLLAYISGFTSILFGVLVRIRAPLIPFALIILLINTKKNEETNLLETE